MAARRSSTQSVPISRTNCGISVSSVCLTFSISDKHSSIQYAKAPGEKKKKKVAKTTKEKGENSNQMSNLVGYTLTRPASGEKHGNWAVVGDTISGHRELTPKHIPHLNFCRSLFSFSAHPASSCFALIGTGFKNE